MTNTPSRTGPGIPAHQGVSITPGATALTRSGASSTASGRTGDSDLGALFARVTAVGATVPREPRNEDYQGRDFAVADPRGNQRSFGTDRE